MKKLSALSILFLLISCDGYYEPYNYTYQPDIYHRKVFTTNVVSEPPGARIELDGDYIGDAPLEIQWEGLSYNKVFTRDHIIKALPIHAGQYVQSKSFYGRSWVQTERSPIPKTIFFDMNLAFVPTRFEVDIK